MKQLKFFILFFLFISLFVFGCEKNELNPSNDSLMKKGRVKPPKEPAYILSDTITPLQVYGVWHAGNDYCTWGTVRDMSDFDSSNNWIIDRGDGVPSVNLVVLSFVNQQ